MSKVTTRSRAQRRRKRPSPTKRESKNATRVSELVKDLGIAGLAALMGASTRSITRWNSGAAMPSGPAAAFLAVLDRLRREYVKLDALPARLQILLQDDFQEDQLVSLEELVGLWFESRDRAAAPPGESRTP